MVEGFTEEDMVEEPVISGAERMVGAGLVYATRAKCNRLIAEVQRLRDILNRPFPIQGGPSVPWSAMLPHESQSQRNHDQSIRRIAERGGFDPFEAWCVVNGMTWREAEKKYTQEEIVKKWFEFAAYQNETKQ